MLQKMIFLFNKIVFFFGGDNKKGDRKVNARAYCSWFNFKGPDQQKKVSMLSGGERNR
jgi:ATPase subunit of ABC transporter with duplicated ATPase domains